MTTVTVDRGGRSERESRPARPEVPAGSRLEGCPMGSSCRTRACAALTGQVASLLRTRTGSIAAHVIDAEARRTLRRGCTRAALGNRPVGRRLRCGGGVGRRVRDRRSVGRGGDVGSRLCDSGRCCGSETFAVDCGAVGKINTSPHVERPKVERRDTRADTQP